MCNKLATSPDDVAAKEGCDYRQGNELSRPILIKNMRKNSDRQMAKRENGEEQADEKDFFGPDYIKHEISFRVP